MCYNYSIMNFNIHKVCVLHRFPTRSTYDGWYLADGEIPCIGLEQDGRVTLFTYDKGNVLADMSFTLFGACLVRKYIMEDTHA
jgi:hypothetical protein